MHPAQRAQAAVLSAWRGDLRWRGLQAQGYEVALSDRRVQAGEHLVKANRLHPLIPRESQRSVNLYCSRGAVEREFGRLKNEWAMLPLRVRRLERVKLHIDLTILAKLSCALARARAVPLAA